MAAGKEIKRLREKAGITAADTAKLIGVNVDRMRKWEDRDSNPKDTADIQAVEAFFGCSLEDLSKLDTFKFVSRDLKGGQETYATRQNSGSPDYTDEYIALLKEKSRWISSDDLKQRLDEIQAGQLTARHFLGRLLAKVEKQPVDKIESEINKFLNVALKAIGSGGK